MRLATHVDLLNLSSRYKDPVQLYIVSYISNRLIGVVLHACVHQKVMPINLIVRQKLAP
jgi:hypothetical protein